MEQPLARYLRKYFVTLGVLYIVLSMLVAIGRAGFTYGVNSQNITNTPATRRLAAKWSRRYPALQSTNNPPIAAAPQAFDKLILPANLLINLVLDNTLKPPAPHQQASAPEPSQAATPVPTEQPPPPPVSRTPPPPPPPVLPSSPEDDEASAPPPQPLPTAAIAPSPAPQPKPVLDPSQLWAVVAMNQTPVFNAQGQRQGQVSAGAVMDVKQQSRNAEKQELLHGDIHAPEGRFRDVIIKRDRVQLIAGKTLTETTREERQQQSDRGRLMGAIADRREAIELALKNQNPYYREYRQVLQQLKSLRDEANTLKARLDNSTGSTRMEASNRLREIKNEQAPLMADYRSLKMQTEQWDEQNPVSPDALDRAIANDRQLQQLQQQLDAMPTP